MSKGLSHNISFVNDKTITQCLSVKNAKTAPHINKVISLMLLYEYYKYLHPEEVKQITLAFVYHKLIIKLCEDEERWSL